MLLADAHRQLLRDAARRSIERGVATGTELHVSELDYPEPLRLPAATFVTLRCHGELLGCLGSLRPVRPLICDVAHNAHHAAFSDLRFASISAAHLPELDIHISLLGALEPMRFGSEAELLAQLREGIDGLVIADQAVNATFLPVMWDRLPDPATFLAALKEKAGLPSDWWSPTFEASRYTVEDV